MNVTQLPAELSLTSTISDIVIESAESLNFVIEYEGEVILDEKYDADVAGRICIRDLGKIMERYLSGSMLDGQKPYNSGYFRFNIDDVLVGGTLALLCKAHTALAAEAFHPQGQQYPLHLLFGSKITIPTATEHVSFCMNTQDSLTASVIYLENGAIIQSELAEITTVGVPDVYTFAVSLAIIVDLFPNITPSSIIGYEVGVAEIKTQFKIDWTPYVDTKVFRYLNSFACPTTLITRGEISRKRAHTFETSKINGIEHRHAIKRSDAFKVLVGRKFSRMDEALFAEMAVSEQVQIFYRGEFRDIIITEEDSDETQRVGTFSDSSFSFRFADEKLNTMLYEPTWILEDGTWNDWGNWIDDGHWND